MHYLFNGGGQKGPMDNMNVDYKSKQLGIEFLESFGIDADTIKDTDVLSQFYTVDLMCEGSGNTILAEVKRRNYKHDDFGDHCIEKIKYDKTMEVMEVSGFTASRLITIFKDFTIATADMTKFSKSFWKKVQKTYEFEDGDKSLVWKEMLSYPQTHLFEYRFDYIDDDGKSHYKFYKIR